MLLQASQTLTFNSQRMFQGYVQGCSVLFLHRYYHRQLLLYEYIIFDANMFVREKVSSDEWLCRQDVVCFDELICPPEDGISAAPSP